MTLLLALVLSCAGTTPPTVAISEASPGFTSITEAHTTTPPNFKVAFIGDQGSSESSRAVLELIKDEGADMVLHQGDFDYRDDPDAWDQLINDVLGPSFPYFASVGNHDLAAWSGYQQKLQERLERVDDAICVGDLGVKSACIYRGLFFILSGAGTLGSDHAVYIRQQIGEVDLSWRICSWHKNQRLMQVGGKGDEVGWGPYEECRKGGAIIATGHEHSYERTHLMDNFENQTIASTSSLLVLERGKTFAFVSGLGGRSIRGQNDELAANSWWAAVYTSAQGANFGALFCIFNENGVEDRAHCYFKDIDGNIPDEFDVQTPTLAPEPVPIDIKPGSESNSINLRSNGTIPVAVVSSSDLDASREVDKASLTFGKSGDEYSLAKCNKGMRM